MPDLYFGKYAGRVVDNKDAENEGKILVSVPNIYPETENVTARPALPAGFYFVPQAGDKVWVEFEGGDTGKPLWSAVDYPAGRWAGEADRKQQDMRVLKTAAGHVLIFNDTKDDAAITIRDSWGNVIELANARITIQGAATVEIRAPNVIINGRVVAPSPRPRSGALDGDLSGVKVHRDPAQIVAFAGHP